jgi:CxxC-x17-CxxC domain-containing protein
MSSSNRQNNNRNRSYSNNRSQNRSRYSGNKSNYGQRRPVELHTVTCSKCGESTEVPFKPDGTRPVYCRDCYREQKPRR